MCNVVFQHTNPAEKKTAKGVKRSVKDAHLHFAHYLDALNNFRTYHFRQVIKSTSHTVRTVHMCKVDLAPYDTKRWLCDDTIHTDFFFLRIFFSRKSGDVAWQGK